MELITIIPGALLIIAVFSVPVLLIVLAIYFVGALIRIAKANEERALAQKEIAKQLASLTTDLRYLINEKQRPSR